MALPDYLQDTSKDFAKQLTAATSVPINTSTFTGRQFVAGEDPMQTQAVNLATSGIGSYQPFLTAAQGAVNAQTASAGPQAFQQFMSPYQQQVIDTTLTEFDRQQAIADTAMRDRAIQAGAYGGGREGVLAAESARGAAQSRAGLQAQLLAQGFQQAQAAAAQDLAARQGLGTYQTQLGQAGQAQQQAILDAATGAAREAEFEPFTRLGLVGQQLAQVQPGAFPTQTVGYQPPAAPASPLSTALGVGTGIASIGSKLGLFG